MAMRNVYVGYPSAVLFRPDAGAPAEPPAKPAALKQLLWGDTLVPKRRSADGRWLFVEGRKTDGWIRAEDTQAEPLLEVVFVDIGQGDGALLVLPDGRRYVIDAGQGDNMLRFLRWRFGLARRTVFEAAVISHSDADHYGGFEHLFTHPQIHFRSVCTNGLMERVSASSTGTLGALVGSGGQRYATELVSTLAGLKAFLADPARWTGKKYPTMLKQALDAGAFDDFRGLKLGDPPLPGLGPSARVSLELLGPAAEKVGDADGLRWFGDVGRTKNGHSVVFRLRYGNVALLLGGDLNLESSRLLLERHTGLSGRPANAEAEEALVHAARLRFRSDVAKACHHGSADTLLPLMRAIDPIATVVSSGDDEPYAHPRADALGAIAKCSRGLRPLILSTELARSSPDVVKHPIVLRAALAAAAQALAAATDERARAKAQKAFEALLAQVDRSVAVYGAINLRTDGRRVVLAYKLERSTPSKGWDLYRLEPQGEGGPLAYVSPYD